MIHNEKSLNKIRGYIFNNPVMWAMDRANPRMVNPELENGWLESTNPPSMGPTMAWLEELGNQRQLGPDMSPVGGMGRVR
ncbi:MAG: hypothetical protein OEZ32_10550 [Nitrospinota bacterium]|nr:hypothetical protein [Nitrospinota bacterium]